MPYLTPGQILAQAGPVQRSHHHSDSSPNGVIAPAQLHYQSSLFPTSSRATQQSPVVSGVQYYAGHSSHHSARHPSGSGDVYYPHGHYSGVPVHQNYPVQSMPVMNLGGGTYAPTSSPVPVSVYHHSSYAATQVPPVTAAPLSERRNSLEHPGSFGQMEGSGGSSHVFAGYSSHSNQSTGSQNQVPRFDHPHFLPGNRFKETQYQTQYPQSLDGTAGYPVKEAQSGPVRTPTRSSHAQTRNLPHTTSQRPRAKSNASKHVVNPRLSENPYPLFEGHLYPRNCALVPQRIYDDDHRINKGMSSIKPIPFRMKKAPVLGVRLSDCLNPEPKYHPIIEGTNDIVLSQKMMPWCYRQLKIHICWPGYHRCANGGSACFVRNITLPDAGMTRLSLLLSIVAAIESFYKEAQVIGSGTRRRTLAAGVALR
ncbi:hypothetical protein GYMLUDRAFT_910665 [Collybiopsis luxurians FD-317 M1]|nr:hypothetical protein GYMLUDRAFT_910665 [Collybiopsis luxurians FD-317 M1]